MNNTHKNIQKHTQLTNNLRTSSKSHKKTIQINENQFDLVANQSCFVPIGAKHRLSNSGKDRLIIIEVQSGTYLGEDDIIRFQDKYGREVL